MKKYIKDLEGELIEVTNLKEAIFQVAMYMGLLYNNQCPQQQSFARKRQKYWKDLYHKLNQLRTEQE